MTPNKRTLLCLMMAFWNKSHYQSLVQIWGVTKETTAEKAREMFLENEQRLKVDSGASALVTRSHGHESKEANSCRHYGKTRHKKDLC